MKKEDLEKLAIDIKGKKYIQVKDRVLYFNEEYKNGMIETELLSQPNEGKIVFIARVTPDVENPDRVYTGHAQEDISTDKKSINSTAALENAETSAVGRALALMGIGVIDSVASVDEMKKAGAYKPTYPTPADDISIEEDIL